MRLKSGICFQGCHGYDNAVAVTSLAACQPCVAVLAAASTAYDNPQSLQLLTRDGPWKYASYAELRELIV
jgi:hypothetical protein